MERVASLSAVSVCISIFSLVGATVRATVHALSLFIDLISIIFLKRSSIRSSISVSSSYLSYSHVFSLIQLMEMAFNWTIYVCITNERQFTTAQKCHMHSLVTHQSLHQAVWCLCLCVCSFVRLDCDWRTTYCDCFLEFFFSLPPL